jgi:hypothetical protein
MMLAFDEAIGAIPDLRKSEEEEDMYIDVNDDECEVYDDATKDNIIKVVESKIIVEKMTIRECFGIEGHRLDALVHPFFLKY